jgi:hypothetical protein
MPEIPSLRGLLSVAAVLVVVTNAQVTRPDFSGRWALAEATYPSRWKGTTLESRITRKVNARGNATEVRYHERLILTPDSGLVIETTVDGRLGGRRSVYRKTQGW